MSQFGSYAEYYDLINSDKPYKKECEFVYEWAGKPVKILDIGCGTASYWRYFPLSSVKMIGWEKSQEMINRSKYATYIYTHDVVDPGTLTLEIQEFDCVFALFDVVNYMPSHRWWPSLPLKKGGFFIFDIWDIEKVNKECFQERTKEHFGFRRIIKLDHRVGDKVTLTVKGVDKFLSFEENHTLYLYSEADILNYCGRNFEIVEKKETDTWQTWYKLRKL
jgi:SAM-dependent methyltransferase